MADRYLLSRFRLTGLRLCLMWALGNVGLVGIAGFQWRKILLLVFTYCGQSAVFVLGRIMPPVLADFCPLFRSVGLQVGLAR